MDDEKLLEQLKRLGVWSGHRDMTMEDLARIQPGLGRIMPEVGDRTWKLYYAAQAENWPLAAFQAKEIKGLMELGAFTRPKHVRHMSSLCGRAPTNRFTSSRMWRPNRLTR